MPDKDLSENKVKAQYEELGLREMGLSYEDWLRTIPETQKLVRKLVEAVTNQMHAPLDALTEHVHRTWRESS